MLALTEGVSFNPVFTSIGFHPVGGEIALFSRVRIPLVHGWLVDPANREEYDAISRVKNRDYVSAHKLITDMDHLTGGRLMETHAEQAGPSGPNTNLTEEEKLKYKDGEYLLGPVLCVDICRCDRLKL
jgi:MINDY deubiquitinase